MKPKVYSFLGGLSGLGSTREKSPPSGEKFSPKGDDEAERITRLDAERNARDKAIGRGADYAPTVRDAEIDRIARTDGWQPPAGPPPSEINRTEAEAKALGWDHGRLWNFSFWPNTRDQPRGLASVMSEVGTIAEVSDEVITILASKRFLQLFLRKTSQGGEHERTEGTNGYSFSQRQKELGTASRL